MVFHTKHGSMVLSVVTCVSKNVGLRNLIFLYLQKVLSVSTNTFANVIGVTDSPDTASKSG